MRTKPRTTGRAFFGTEEANLRPSHTWEDRRGRSFELAALALAFGTVPRGTLLVHGTVRPRISLPSWIIRVPHAWLLLPDGQVWEPVTRVLYVSNRDWCDYAQAVEDCRFTYDDLQSHVATYGHFGPWRQAVSI